jgi:hypothetical protein
LLCELLLCELLLCELLLYEVDAVVYTVGPKNTCRLLGG